MDTLRVGDEEVPRIVADTRQPIYYTPEDMERKDRQLRRSMLLEVVALREIVRWFVDDGLGQLPPHLVAPCRRALRARSRTDV